MYYSLNNNVYIVKGKAKGCIYDLNTSKLYSVNKALADKLVEINKNGLFVDDVDYELKSILQQLVKNGLVKMTQTHSPNNIKDIIDEDTGCKFAWIEITNKCNLKCIHCYNESDARCDNIMSITDFYRVVDYLVNIGVSKIQITGGEAFLNKEILRQMLSYTVGKFDFIEIFTNGTLITDEWFEYLRKNKIHIALSVYSYDSKMHDSVTRVRGSHNKTYKTIEKLKKFGISYRVCNVLMNGIELGEKNSDLYILSENKDVVRVTGRADFNLLNEELIKKRLITKETFQIPITRAFCKRLISGHNCFNDKIYIAANLDVFPCVMERRIKHGNLKQNDFQLNNDIRKFTKDKIEECSECEYRYACFDCRPNSLSRKISEKPWYCTYNPLTGNWEDIDGFILNLKGKLRK